MAHVDKSIAPAGVVAQRLVAVAVASDVQAGGWTQTERRETMFTSRLATEADLAALTGLMNLAIEENLKPLLWAAQIAASYALQR